MSAKTKIVVVHLKRMIFTVVTVALILILAVLLCVLLAPKNDEQGEEAVPTLYVPGVYTSSVQLNDTSLDVQVVVDENHINSISLVNLDESMETMYPLVGPALDELADQIVSSQSTENLSYSESSQYTSMVLLAAIEDALDKAEIVMPR